jgi:hypothetical protein
MEPTGTRQVDFPSRERSIPDIYGLKHAMGIWKKSFYLQQRHIIIDEFQKSQRRG